MMNELKVPPKYDNKKLNTFLLDQIDGLSLNSLYKILRKKDVKINEKRVHENVVLHLGDIVKVYLPQEALASHPKENFVIPIIYEDTNILLVNKPAGIEVTGSQNSVTNYLQKQKGNSSILPCHRLDRNTTGIVVFAKTEEARILLLEKFKQRQIDKYYLANVYPIPTLEKETLVSYLFKDQKKAVVYISDTPKKGYVKIVTHYTVLQKNFENNTALLEVKLETRKNASNSSAFGPYWPSYYWGW